jgi:probable rRNA maturation factor
MAVLIDNRQNGIKISPEVIRRTAQTLLSALAFPDGELSIVIVDDRQIAELNDRYLNRTGPTNVMAFPMREGDFSEVTPTLLGDVVISVETAANEAATAVLATDIRFKQLLVHGILHLFGYDHELNEADALLMEEKSKELMERIAGFSCCP